MPSLLGELDGITDSHTIISDVGSVKTDLYRAVKESAPNLLPQFVFAHPIAGGERSGVRAAKLGLFKNKHVIVTKTPETDPKMMADVIRMWDSVGANVLEMGLQEHDAVFARTSHLPHVIAFTLVNYLSKQTNREQLFDLAAAGFYDFTRIASSDAEMWRDICITNKEQVLSSLEGFAEQINAVKALIDAEDLSGLLEYFSAAKEARDTGLLLKARSVLDDC